MTTKEKRQQKLEELREAATQFAGLGLSRRELFRRAKDIRGINRKVERQVKQVLKSLITIA